MILTLPTPATPSDCGVTRILGASDRHRYESYLSHSDPVVLALNPFFVLEYASFPLGPSVDLDVTSKGMIPPPIEDLSCLVLLPSSSLPSASYTIFVPDYLTLMPSVGVHSIWTSTQDCSGPRGSQHRCEFPPINTYRCELCGNRGDARWSRTRLLDTSSFSDEDSFVRTTIFILVGIESWFERSGPLRLVRRAR